jgi:hypothetical protein
VPSSGSSSVPSELQLHDNLGFWLIKFCVVCGCVYVVECMWLCDVVVCMWLSVCGCVYVVV